MKPIDVSLNRLAARQYSLAHRPQLLELGMTPRQVQSRVEAGWLVPVHRGVYRLAGAPESREQLLLAACLATSGVASHRSAAVLWGLRGVDDGPTEVVVPAGSHTRLPGVDVHRTDSLDPADASRTRRIPVTTPARTLLDLGAVVPALVVESALEDALMRRLVTLGLLTSTLARLGRPGRSGAGVMRALVEARDPASAPSQSVLEDRLFQVLRRAGLPDPIRQYRVAGVVLDGAYPHLRLGLEADSRIWHGGRLDVQRNSDNHNRLVAHGWKVLRFTWFDVTRHPDQVVAAVERELVLACPA